MQNIGAYYKAAIDWIVAHPHKTFWSAIASLVAVAILL